VRAWAISLYRWPACRSSARIFQILNEASAISSPMVRPMVSDSARRNSVDVACTVALPSFSWAVLTDAIWSAIPSMAVRRGNTSRWRNAQPSALRWRGVHENTGSSNCQYAARLWTSTPKGGASGPFRSRP
jgi:hypothetical protein